MESRKIIKFGNSSYAITLPNEWVKKNNLDNQNSLDICVNKDNLIVNIEKKKEDRIATISIKNKNLKLVNREIISFYLKNYDTIILEDSNIVERLEEIKIMKDKLSSIEIIEISEDKIVLKDLTSLDSLDVNKLISEIIDMLKLIFNELSKSNEENKTFLISSLDSNVNKLSFLANKAINYNLDNFKYPDEIKDTINYWRTVHSLESIGDKLKRIARYLKEKKLSPKVYEVIEDIKSYFIFVTSLVNEDVILENNLKIHLDKKQSLLMEFEALREEFGDELTLYLVLTQLFKDLIGVTDNIILSAIDSRNT